MGKAGGEEYCMLESSPASLFTGILSVLLYQLLPALFLLAFCITIHEFGHFLLAKLLKIPVEKFSLGFGPPLIRKKIGETDFRIAYFPVGGYVKMAGEEEGEFSKTDDVHPIEPQRDETVGRPGLYDAPIYKRILIIFAGPFFNITSAVLVMLIAYSIFGLAVDPYTTIEVEEMSVAERAGFVNGDSVVEVNGIPIETWDDFVDLISKNINEEITVTVMRENKELSINVVVDPDSLGITNLVPPILGAVKRGGPAYRAGMVEGDRVITVNNLEVHSWYELVELVRESADSSLSLVWEHESEVKSAEIVAASRYDYVLQDTIKQIGVLKPHSRIYLPPGRLVIIAIERTAGITWMTLNIFYQLIVGRISRRAVGGPIAIFQLTTESASWGFEYILSILIIISINLGLINLFPVPALDGGHIVIATIEAIRRKRFSKKTRILIQQIGYAIIFLLIIFVTFNDITR